MKSSLKSGGKSLKLKSRVFDLWPAICLPAKSGGPDNVKFFTNFSCEDCAQLLKHALDFVAGRTILGLLVFNQFLQQ